MQPFSLPASGDNRLSCRPRTDDTTARSPRPCPILIPVDVGLFPQHSRALASHINTFAHLHPHIRPGSILLKPASMMHPSTAQSCPPRPRPPTRPARMLARARSQTSGIRVWTLKRTSPNARRQIGKFVSDYCETDLNRMKSCSSL